MNTDIENTQEQIEKMIDSMPKSFAKRELFLVMNPCRLQYIDENKIPENIMIKSYTECPIDSMYISESSFVFTDSQ